MKLAGERKDLFYIIFEKHFSNSEFLLDAFFGLQFVLIEIEDLNTLNILLIVTMMRVANNKS